MRAPTSSSEWTSEVVAALQRLPSAQRTAVEHVYLDRCTVAETSRRMRLPFTAVCRLLGQALSGLGSEIMGVGSGSTVVATGGEVG